MKIIHRISYNPSRRKKVTKKLRKLGITLKESGNKKVVLLNYFDICEDDPTWPKVKEILLTSKIGLDPTWTEFTKEEILSAEWVKIASDFIHGFPMPKMDSSWKEISFDCEKVCSECGIGLKQKAPIHLEGEPELEGNDFMAIYWTYNFFARPKIFDVMLENDIQGFEILPAIDHSTNTPLDTIKQMKVTNELSPCIIEDNLQRDNNKCEHIKYWVLSRGMLKFFKTSFSNLPDLIKTNEWFGTGHEAIQLTLASNKFVQLYYENNWKGLFLAPVELI
jgi:hypothetical protein